MLIIRVVLIAGFSLATVLVTWTTARSQSVRLNELVALDSELLDSDGETSDWIEIENIGSDGVDIGGYSISDDEDGADRWSLPEGLRLAGGARIIILASGKDRTSETELHADFRLDGDGETVTLFDAEGAAVDRIEFPPQVSGASFGRSAVDGEWRYLLSPTAGAPNSGPAVEQAPPQVPEVSPGAGFADGPLDVTIATSPELQVRYAVDGSEPGEDSPVLEGTLRLEHTTVLRAAYFFGNRRIGRVATASYFIGVQHDIEVMSLVSAPASFFDPESGIYTNPAGRGQEWERPVSAELFSAAGDRRFAVDAGVRIHGNTTRQSPKKSLRLYFRGRYGPSVLRFPLFDDPQAATEFNRLILFMGTELVTTIPVEDITFIRRNLLQPLFGSLGQVRLHHKPVALYLNGEYWGLYFLSERADEDFVESYVGGDDWDVIEGLNSAANVLAGDQEEWIRFLDALQAGEFERDGGHEALLREIDLDNVTAYFLLFNWSIFRDEALNLRSARARVEDGRWRFIPWDASAFRESSDPFEVDSIGSLLRNRFADFVSLLFSALMNDEGYRQQFFERLRSVMENELSPATFAAVVDAYRRSVASEMPRESERWGFLTVSQWEENMASIARFAQWRAVSLPMASARWLPALEVPVPIPEPLPDGTRIAVVHPDEGARESDLAFATRLENRGASVSLLSAAEAVPGEMAQEYDLAIVGAGVRPPSFDASVVETTLPVLFSEPALLRDALRLAVRTGLASFDVVQREDGSDELLDGIPLWGLRYLDAPEQLGVPVGGLGEGVRSVVVELRSSGRTSNRPVLLAEAGSRDLDGRRLTSRAAYFAVNDVRSLGGYGWELLDRIVAWAISGTPLPDPAFVRGDVGGDQNVTMADALTLLDVLFAQAGYLDCADAADANDDGRVNVTDAVTILRHLFMGASPPSPFPAAGTDPTPDALRCLIR